MSPEPLDFNPWTVSPETERLDLEWNGNAFYIVIKKRLNTYEDRLVKGAALHGMRGFARPGQNPDDADPELLLNMREAGFVRLEVYVVEWSLATSHGVRLALPSKDRGQAGALDPRLTLIMEDAITAYLEKRDAEDEPLKKVGSGTRPLKTISA